jgi:hypothetical protein
LRIDNPYYIAERKATKRTVRAAIYSFLYSLVIGFTYARLARILFGLPPNWIGATAIIAQILTYFSALALQLGRFWK